MLPSKAAGEASVRPRLIEMVMRIGGAAAMPDPLIVLGVNVRNLRMTFLVRANAVLGRGRGLLPSCRFRSTLSPGRLYRSRTASRNVSTANRRRVTAPALLPALPLLLRKRCHANQYR